MATAIFRAWITVNGEKIYAKDYGKKAFVIYIDDESKNDNKKATLKKSE